MANNPYPNKVEYAGQTIMDITDTTAESNDVLQGKVFYSRSGERSTGSLGDFTGATSSDPGTHGLVPAPAAGDNEKFLCGDGTFKTCGKPMIILSYGASTWQDFITAYESNSIVYCRASSNSDPASGAQNRLAFMAYVNNASTPTEVEFQYYRSVSSHSATQMGDQVFVYKLTQANGWTVTTREASIKEIDVASGSKLAVSWSGNKVTLSNTMTANDMPMSSSDSTTVLAELGSLNSNINDLSFEEIKNGGTTIGAYLLRLGKIRILSFPNRNMSISTSGFTLGSNDRPYKDAMWAPCKYYSGSADTAGMIKIAYDGTVTINSYSGSAVNASYVGGEVVYFAR